MQRCLRNRCAGAPKVCWRHSRRYANLLVLLLLPVTHCAAAPPVSWVASLVQPAPNTEVQREAITAIPLKRVAAPYRQAVHRVVNSPSLFRRLPKQVVDCDPQLFTFLAVNPEVMVQIWRQLGITKVRLERINDNSFHLSDGVGTTGKLTIVEQTCEPGAQNRIVMYVEGGFEGKPFAQPITAQCVLILRSGSLVETNGRTYVATQLDSFVRIDRASIEFLAKALHPLVGRTADKNFGDTITFVGSFSRAAETGPDRIERLAYSLPQVTPDRQRELAEIAHRAAIAASKGSSRTAASAKPSVQRLASRGSASE